MIRSFLFFATLLAPGVVLGQRSADTSNVVYLRFSDAETKPGPPPSLSYGGLIFEDADRNYLISAAERARVSFTVENRGQGTAYGILVRARVANGLPGIQFPDPLLLDSLAPGASRRVDIALAATEAIETGVANLVVEIREDSKPTADQISLDVPTEEFKTPELKFVNYTFDRSTDRSDNDRVDFLTPITLSFNLQNRGRGNALNVVLDFALPPFVKETDRLQYRVDTLRAGESREVAFEFLITRQFKGNAIPVKVTASERFKKYGQSLTMQLNLGQQSGIGWTRVVAEETDRPGAADAGEADAVDLDIPRQVASFPNRFALVVGNQAYASVPNAGVDTATSVAFARRDAEVFREYCLRTLGIPVEQVLFLPDASRERLAQALDQLSLIAKGKAGKAELVFYYAGRGLTGSRSESPYLVPVDAERGSTQRCIGLTEVYAKLSEHPTKRITVFLETDFVAQASEAKLPADKKRSALSDAPKGNAVVLAASAASGRAFAYPEKRHGLFTYALLSQLRASKGEGTYGDLADFLAENVVTRSALLHRTGQEPQVRTGKGVDKNWKRWTVR
ncbi:MAG: caspase family protein [Ferruginibacter sp.]|nr:caspase family protein [Cytophagales bacterium]